LPPSSVTISISLLSRYDIQFLKGVEEYKFKQEIIWHEMVKYVHTKIYMYIPVYTWTCFVCTVLLLSSMFRTRTALEEELAVGTCKPTVFQGDIMMILKTMLSTSQFADVASVELGVNFLSLAPKEFFAVFCSPGCPGEAPVVIFQIRVRTRMTS
jgi:hypothetical protein